MTTRTITSTTSPPVLPDSLESLLIASSTGDATAFSELYESIAARVYGIVLRLLRDEHQSEEVTQEVLLLVWQTSSRFDPQRGSALTWVLTLAHRKAVDRVRSSESRRRRDTDHAESTQVQPYDQTASSAHASIDAQAVRAALTTLTPTQRQSIELAYFGGHTHTEVSRLMQVPLGTAKTRIRDGLLRLRDAMGPAVETA